MGHEFALYVFRNPDIQPRVSAARAEAMASLTEFPDHRTAARGARVTISMPVFAELLVATSDAVVLADERSPLTCVTRC